MGFCIGNFQKILKIQTLYNSKIFKYNIKLIENSPELVQIFIVVPIITVS